MVVLIPEYSNMIALVSVDGMGTDGMEWIKEWNKWDGGTWYSEGRGGSERAREEGSGVTQGQKEGDGGADSEILKHDCSGKRRWDGDRWHGVDQGMEQMGWGAGKCQSSTLQQGKHYFGGTHPQI